jgi:hypothetical protein
MPQRSYFIGFVSHVAPFHYSSFASHFTSQNSWNHSIALLLNTHTHMHNK